MMKRRKPCSSTAMDLAITCLTFWVISLVQMATAINSNCFIDAPGCSCHRSAESYEIFCPDATSKKFSLHYNPNVMVVECDPDAFDLRTIIPDMIAQFRKSDFTYITNFDTIEFRYCPVPEVSFSTIFKAMNISTPHALLIKYSVSANATFTSNLFAGLEDLRILQVQSTSHLGRIDADAFRNLTGLERLIIRSNNLESLPEDVFAPLESLVYLQFAELYLSQLPERLFSRLIKLEKLIFQAREFKSLPKNLFANLTNLQALSFLSSSGDTEVPPGIFDPLVNLKELNVTGNLFENAPANLFTKTTSLESITWRLFRCPFGQECRDYHFANGIFHGAQSLKQLTIQRMINVANFTLSSDTFKGCTGLEELTILDAKLTSLPSGLFKDTTKLRKLDLSYNLIGALPSDIFSTLTDLTNVILTSNEIPHLDDELFVASSKLSEMRFNRNRIVSINEDFFRGLSSLEVADMSHNDIRWTNAPKLHAMQNLKSINFAHNEIEEVDTLNHWTYNLVQLENLDLSFNKIGPSLQAIDLKFVASGAQVDLSFNEIRHISFGLANLIPSNDHKKTPVVIKLNGNPLDCDCRALDFLDAVTNDNATVKTHMKLEVTQLQCNQPEELSKRAFISVRPEELFCPFPFPEAGLNASCPTGCKCTYAPSEREVRMDCSAQELVSFPSYIPKISQSDHATLDLSENKIQDLKTAKQYVKNFETISKLHLTKNRIVSIDLQDLPMNLTELAIDKNQINYVSPDLIEYMKQMTAVWLSENDFDCKCSAVPLSNFVKQYHPNFPLKDADAVTLNCDEPKALLNQAEEEFCVDARDILLTIVLPIIVIFAVLCALILIYLCNKELIQVCIYSNPKLRKVFGMCLEGPDDDKEKDAFISYVEEDKDYVENYLVPKLENDDDLRYECIVHVRDFAPGREISEQIVEAVDTSCRTVIVLSKNFVRSPWANQEFKLAHDRNCAIVVVYGELPTTEELGPMLSEYVRTNTYLSHDDPWFWEKLRYALPHKGTKEGPFRTRRPTDQMQLISRSQPSNGGHANPNFTGSPEVIHVSPPSTQEEIVPNGLQNGHATRA